jgi:hypothetical protein
MRPVSIARATAGVAVEGLLILATIAALVLAGTIATRGEPNGATSAFAARSSGVITVPDGVFAGTTTATANPGGEGTWVMAECYQNGAVAYRQYVKVDPLTHQATLTLGPTPSWSSGAASCYAEEGTWFKGSRWRVVATTTFEVSG